MHELYSRLFNVKALLGNFVRKNLILSNHPQGAKDMNFENLISNSFLVNCLDKLPGASVYIQGKSLKYFRSSPI